ncbi:hypothetical protein N1030_12855 [Desulfovibrio mangrovi]|uniref:hypothetical protein n=1 Tax=Desulfovibrio mangrovi TaxID=2976983 RepID=UPI0022478F20|nr:hypothetical protein [Desulfovibrio mangrovi]UZP66491.1 hypothetical protein N1030_12855 [Desulfovibrio mangrovi]
MNNNVQNSPSFASALDAFGNGLHHAHADNAHAPQPAFASALDAFGSGLHISHSAPPYAQRARKAGQHACDLNGLCYY